jgi:hypothetical protein
MCRSPDLSDLCGLSKRRCIFPGGAGGRYRLGPRPVWQRTLIQGTVFSGRIDPQRLRLCCALRPQVWVGVLPPGNIVQLQTEDIRARVVTNRIDPSFPKAPETEIELGVEDVPD